MGGATGVAGAAAPCALLPAPRLPPPPLVRIMTLSDLQGFSIFFKAIECFEIFSLPVNTLSKGMKLVKVCVDK